MDFAHLLDRRLPAGPNKGAAKLPKYSGYRRSMDVFIGPIQIAQRLREPVRPPFEYKPGMLVLSGTFPSHR
jgi:hypothetical protein